MSDRTGLVSVPQKLSLSSGTVRGDLQGNQWYDTAVDDLLADLKPSIRYRTPADVRAIPNQQWERWVLGYESYPFSEFSAAGDVQETVGAIVDATCRRLDMPLPKRKRKKLS